MASLKRIAAAAVVVGLASMLTMCSGTGGLTGGNTVTITYDREGEAQTVTYNVPDAKCDERRVSSMRLDKPFGYFSSSWSGDHTIVKGWLSSDQFALFKGEGTRQLDADSMTYTFTGEGTVGETDAVGQGKEPNELVESAIEYPGSITATVRCAATK